MDKNFKISTYVIMSIFLIGTFYLHLMPTLIAGVVVFLLIKNLYEFLHPKFASEMANKLTLASVAGIVSLSIGLLILLIYSIFHVDNNQIQNMFLKTMNILEELKKYLPTSIIAYIPGDAIILKEKLVETLKSHNSEIFTFTKGSLKGLIHVLMGTFIGAVTAFAFLKFKKHEANLTSFSNEMLNRFSIFGNVFENVVFAQVKISFINTIFTAIYLMIFLPIVFDIKIPYAFSLVLLTFFAGLIPVIGNLISNTFIILISLSVSFQAAVSSMIFLVVIHKLEYYINAKIVGDKIKTQIFELLIAMVIMESLFGLIGVAIAPIIYGYIKEEMKLNHLI